MPANILQPTLLRNLTTASDSGQPCVLSPSNAGEILACCRFIDKGQTGRSRKTIPELMSIFNAGEWNPDISEIAVAKFPNGTLTVLNGHNRLSAFSQREVPTATRVRLLEVNDEDDFRLLYSRFDAATTLRSFGLRARSQGCVVPSKPFSGSDATRGGVGSGPPTTVAAAFIVDSMFDERPRLVGIDGWKSINHTYEPTYRVLSEIVAPIRTRAGNRKILRLFDNTTALAVFLVMFKTNADLCRSFISRLLGADGGVDDSVRSMLWTRIDNIDSAMRWAEAVKTLHISVIHAWGNVVKGRRVGALKRRPTGVYHIAGSRYVYRTKEALRKFKAEK